jgi:molecular chaperone GrpE
MSDQADNNLPDAEEVGETTTQAGPPQGGAAPGTPGDAKAEIENLRAEKAALFERLARAQAEFQNSRKRLEGEFETRLQYANSTLLKNLLPVIDNFERALAVDPTKADTASVLSGLQMVHDQMMAILKQQQLELIDPPVGTPFDPLQHEAILQQPSDKHADGPVVLHVAVRGYTLHSRTLRPAQVIVSKPA